MWKGLYAAASGMRFQTDKLNEAANNLANVSTAGYKRSVLVGESFDGLVTKFSQPTPLNTVGAGVLEVGKFRIDNQGSLVRTSNPLNFAISGDGYFQVQAPDGTIEVSRDGDFSLDTQGYLVSHANERVLDVNNQPIRLAGLGVQPLEAREDGTLVSGNQVLARLKIVTNADADTPNFPVSQAALPPSAAGYKIQQGYLESSNVNVVQEMVNLINISHLYTSESKAISENATLLDKTVNDLGRLS
ncbi:MAG TPA: flagellar hook basal-body protein [Oscillatoriaceae cyanobacterium]